MDDLRFSAHALWRCRKRLLDMRMVVDTVTHPEQIIPQADGTYVHQRRFDEGGRSYLMRVFVDHVGVKKRIISVYRTSNMTKYWSPS